MDLSLLKQPPICVSEHQNILVVRFDMELNGMVEHSLRFSEV